MREELAQRVALDEDAMQKSWRASVDGTTPLLGPNCPCLSTLHALTTSKSPCDALGLRSMGISHASIACMRVTLKKPRLTAEMPAFVTYRINRFSLPFPKMQHQKGAAAAVASSRSPSPSTARSWLPPS